MGAWQLIMLTLMVGIMQTLFVVLVISFVAQDAFASDAESISPVNDSNRFNWSVTTDSFQEGRIVSAGDERVKSVSSWIDSIDSMVRSRYAKKLSAVPKPRGLVMDGEQDGVASVLPAYVCVDFKTKFSSLGSGDGRTVDLIVFRRRDGLFLEPMTKDPCNSPLKSEVMNLEEQQDFIEWYFAPFQGQCSLEIDSKRRLITFSKPCDKLKPASLENVSGARQLALPVTADVITVSSQLLDKASENRIAVTLAHELGHYYKSHMTTVFKKEYGYFFFFGSRQSAGKPLSSKAATVDGLKALHAVLRERDYRYAKYYPVSGQKFHSVLFRVLSSMAYYFVGLTLDPLSSSLSPCKDFQEHASSEQGLDSIGSFPQGPLPETGRSFYREFEKKAAVCLKRIKVVSKQKDDSGEERTDLYGEEILDAVASELASLGDDVEKRAKQIRIEMCSEGATADKVFLGLGEQITNVLKQYEEQEIIAPLKVIVDKEIGFFTDEQEADELSAQWLIRLGTDPKDIFESFLDLQALEDKTLDVDSRYYGYLGAEQCRDRLAKAFENHNFDWKKNFVAPGFHQIGQNMGDIDHHLSSCHRAYNFAREYARHGYVE